MNNMRIWWIRTKRTPLCFNTQQSRQLQVISFLRAIGFTILERAIAAKEKRRRRFLLRARSETSNDLW